MTEGAVRVEARDARWLEVREGHVEDQDGIGDRGARVFLAGVASVAGEIADDVEGDRSRWDAGVGKETGAGEGTTKGDIGGGDAVRCPDTPDHTSGTVEIPQSLKRARAGDARGYLNARGRNASKSSSVLVEAAKGLSAVDAETARLIAGLGTLHDDAAIDLRIPKSPSAEGRFAMGGTRGEEAVGPCEYGLEVPRLSVATSTSSRNDTRERVVLTRGRGAAALVDAGALLRCELALAGRVGSGGRGGKAVTAKGEGEVVEDIEGRGGSEVVDRLGRDGLRKIETGRGCASLAEDLDNERDVFCSDELKREEGEGVRDQGGVCAKMSIEKGNEGN